MKVYNILYIIICLYLLRLFQGLLVIIKTPGVSLVLLPIVKLIRSNEKVAVEAAELFL